MSFPEEAQNSGRYTSCGPCYPEVIGREDEYDEEGGLFVAFRREVRVSDDNVDVFPCHSCDCLFQFFDIFYFCPCAPDGIITFVGRGAVLVAQHSMIDRLQLKRVSCDVVNEMTKGKDFIQGTYLPNPKMMHTDAGMSNDEAHSNWRCDPRCREEGGSVIMP
jgi:hypothetical protein